MTSSAQLRGEDVAQNGRQEVCTKGGVCAAYKRVARIFVRIAYKMAARMLYAPYRMAARKFVQKIPVVRVKAPPPKAVFDLRGPSAP